MSKRKHPAATLQREARGRVQWSVAPSAFDRWAPNLVAAAEDDERSISIYDVIGEDWYTGEGVTLKRIDGALRRMGPGPVTVNINSPGGDLFEGLGIYELLREHDGEVHVKVLGLAASAASVIAMAGDSVQIGRAGFFMIHNCWGLAIGNRNDLREIADILEPFDRAMADIYAAHSGMERDDVLALMDAETWLGGSDAIDRGFADELLPGDQIERDEPRSRAAAVRRVEAALRASGMPRNAAERLIHEFKSSVRDAAGSGEGDPTDRGAVEPAAVSSTRRQAESLIGIFPRR